MGSPAPPNGTFFNLKNKRSDLSLIFMKTEQIIHHTQAWLTSFIIQYNICPFAKKEHDNGRIHYAVDDSTDIEHCLETVFDECHRLDNHSNIETTLIIFPNNLSQFEDYLDFLSLAESLLIDQNYEGVYQLASFHPLYCFEGANTNDPANYTNRSPYPMLHLIREASLESALKSFPNPEKIPQQNIKLTRELGLQKVQEILRQSINGNE